MTKPLPAAGALLKQARQQLDAIHTRAELEAWRLEYLSRQGSVSRLLRAVKDLPLDERQVAGQERNQLRQELEALYQQHWEKLQLSVAPATPQASEKKTGALHPLTLTVRRIQEIFTELGFTLAEGPLVESTKYNFDKLNMPPEHPARAETDTFYLANGHVLRTATSTVQIRGVEEGKLTPPFRLFSPGRVFRAEKIDPTHSHTFYQFEGLVVDRQVSIADFKGVIEHFYSTFLQQVVTTRLRPSYFPFVEPGFEVDMSCIFCQQKGCRVCKKTGWVEIMGAGMVHPQVLRNMKVNPADYQGYAFGGAVDRLTMLHRNIADIRQFWINDFKFLSHFS
jgi:phenylalanyl-tRNA synthetase alpha chain